MLFSNALRENHNDPYLINPKGVKIQVPENRVRELLAQGYLLADNEWQPGPKVQEDPYRIEPLPMQKLREEVSSKLDLLEVTEI